MESQDAAVLRQSLEALTKAPRFIGNHIAENPHSMLLGGNQDIDMAVSLINPDTEEPL